MKQAIHPVHRSLLARVPAWPQNSYQGRAVHPQVAARLRALYQPSVLRLQVRTHALGCNCNADDACSCTWQKELGWERPCSPASFLSVQHSSERRGQQVGNVCVPSTTSAALTPPTHAQNYLQRDMGWGYRDVEEGA